MGSKEGDKNINPVLSPCHTQWWIIFIPFGSFTYPILQEVDSRYEKVISMSERGCIFKHTWELRLFRLGRSKNLLEGAISEKKKPKMSRNQTHLRSLLTFTGHFLYWEIIGAQLVLIIVLSSSNRVVACNQETETLRHMLPAWYDMTSHDRSLYRDAPRLSSLL